MADSTGLGEGGALPAARWTWRATLALAGSTVCGALGVALALHHPLWPAACMALVVGWAAVTAWRPRWWLLALPAALPLLSFSPWTGWFGVDELDMLVLATAAGGYAHRALDPGPPERCRLVPRGAREAIVLGLVLAATSLVSLYRGWVDAGTGFGWFQGYAEAMNSVRLFKAPMFALLLWPLIVRELRRDEARALTLVCAGIAAGTGVVGLAALWERIAYPGLLDFSQLYRTTALFWEMHVGGAAIDGWLAMGMPFVAWTVWRARTPAQWVLSALLALLACYACLTTFSRGVYVSVSCSLVLLGLVLLARRLGSRGRALARRGLAYAAVLGATAAALFVALEGFGGAGLAVMLLLLGSSIVWLGPRLPGWRSAASLGLALALTLEVVAVFGTGTYMFSRVAASDRDLGGRLEHWRNGLSLLQTPADWLFGIGLGRLPASYSRFVPDQEFSGSVRWLPLADGGGAVRLSGPKTIDELGGLFSLTQRVLLVEGATYRIAFDARAAADAAMVVSVCEMHLLYEQRCQGAILSLHRSDEWRHVALALQGEPLSAGWWFAPRRAVLALTVLDAGASVDIDNAALSADAAGPDLVANGDFARDLARWWPSAQYYFVPWHIDSLYLEWLIERGAPALLAGLLLAALALRNLFVGDASRQPAAPFLAAAICGALGVGLVSSLMDAPRVALMFFVLLFLALSIRGERR